ncbi:PWWP domain-containing protein 5-like isoform X1 [Prosopis cineraria]|uniref:PWWP domain-containing protein 5-like isoform X1 n=1 Tax=Prosopis cineraria TaxID=364024 RepID=UPI00240ED34B|nr:PWWP domain-containing protein 5-like isoform X1 [Prosopis cineraria]
MGGFSHHGYCRGKSNDEVPLSADDQKLMSLKHVNQNMTSNVDQAESNVRQTTEAQLGDICEQADSHVRQEMEAKEYNSDEHHNSMDEKAIKHISMKPGSSGGLYQANYILPPEKEGDFSVSDMVWGKVRSHPWWPGQIFDPSDASEKAMKHYKKDCFLVAYFGDRTFAWNEASQLKSFRAHFSNIEKQSNSESFHNAVDCAIDEVLRRVEFGLACSCVPKDAYGKIKFQNVENAGIREEISLRYGLDESLNANSFSPDKLLEYLEDLSQCPTGGFDRLELGIAKAQLLAFYRLKGYSCLPEFQYCGGLDCDIDRSIQDVENNASESIQHETSLSKDGDQASTGHRVSKGHINSYHKRKHNLKDGMYPKKKEKSLSELIGGTLDPADDYWLDEKAMDSLVSPTVSKKRRTVDPYADDTGMLDGRKTISLAKVSSSTKPSFKIGECIRRVASQLTGSPTARSSGDRSQKPDENTDVLSGDVSDDASVQNLEEAKKSSLVDPTEYSSLNDLLSLLHWAAQDPLEHSNFMSVIVSFFSDFRNSIVVGNYSEREITPTNKVSAKRKKQPIAGSPETFEFEDMSDTYWTDRVIQNGSEEQPSKRSRKKENQLVPADPDKPVQVSRRPYSRKRYSDNNNVEASEKPSGYIDDKSPAELVMNFAELDSVPSETNLNKMFRRFGPLKESETEVDTVGSRARVVFKKCADAEVAFNSAKKFNIFGAILVNYQLNYTPSALFKASTVATTHDQEMHLDLSNFEVNMV